MFIDSHAHLDLCKNISSTKDFFQLDLSTIVHISISPQRFLDFYEHSQHPNIHYATGYYPDHANIEGFDIDDSIQTLKNILTTYPHCALGEIGIDLKDDSYGPVERQQELFEKQIILAEELDLPVVIHSRMSFEETFSSLNKYKCPAILHCFSYGMNEAEKILERGDFISFSGILTYPKSTDIQEVAKNIPLDKILFETDAPYLSPVPFRGKPNYPSFVRHTYEYFAELRQIPLEELCQIVQTNFHKAFSLK